jgi:hypothetical protein
MQRRYFLVALGLMGLGTILTPLVSRGEIPLVSALRQGGYVIYFRHGTKGTKSNRLQTGAQLPPNLQECILPEEPLTETGVTMMQTIGTRFKTLKIPVGKVYASPVCRCVESAWFGFEQVEVKPDLNGIIPPDIDTNARMSLNQKFAIPMRGLLARIPAKRTNTIVMAHASNLLALMEVSLSEGEAAIFKPDGQGGFTLVQRLKAEEWVALVPGS